jgi:hypothetical protein
MHINLRYIKYTMEAISAFKPSHILIVFMLTQNVTPDLLLWVEPQYCPRGRVQRCFERGLPPNGGDDLLLSISIIRCCNLYISVA